MFYSANDITDITDKEGCAISAVVLKRECALSEESEEEVYARLRDFMSVMKNSSSAAEKKPFKTRGGLISGDTKRLNDYLGKGKTICGKSIVRAMTRALSCSEVNASMGKICAAPTAGSCGILPAALLTVSEEFDLDEKTLLNGLLTASGVGLIIDSGASLSGAAGGCQSECGAATAMAAAAVVEMMGGTPRMSFDAAAIALKNIMGLVCDPVAGLVESPCAKRNASGVVSAMLCADLALSGIKSVIPFDEVVAAMKKVGHQLPYQLRETALGGIAATPTGVEISKRVHDKQ
jgi:L-serine dehydratase